MEPIGQLLKAQDMDAWAPISHIPAPTALFSFYTLTVFTVITYYQPSQPYYQKKMNFHNLIPKRTHL